MQTWFIRCILLGCLFVSYTSIAKEKLILAFSAIAPYSSVDATGKPIGIEIDILQLLLDDLSLQLETILCHFNDCLKFLERGEADLISGILKTADRQSYMQFIEPAYYAVETDIAFYALAERDIEITTYQQLSGYSIAKVGGAKYFSKFDDDSSLLTSMTDSESVMLRLLTAKRVDLVISLEDTFDLLLQQQQAPQQVKKVTFKYKTALDTYMALSIKSPYVAKLNSFNLSLKKHIENGNVRQIIKKHNINGVVEK